jgi:DNA polymerase III subunit gamma/tau
MASPRRSLVASRRERPAAHRSLIAAIAADACRSPAAALCSCSTFARCFGLSAKAQRFSNALSGAPLSAAASAGAMPAAASAGTMSAAGGSMSAARGMMPGRTMRGRTMPRGTMPRGTMPRRTMRGRTRTMHGRTNPAAVPAPDPVVPAGTAAPTEAGTPSIAAPIPARTPPSAIVPAVISAAENKLHMFDLRHIGERCFRGERAVGDRRRGRTRQV